MVFISDDTINDLMPTLFGDIEPNRGQVMAPNGILSTTINGQTRMLGGCLPRRAVYGSLPFARPFAAKLPLIPRNEWVSRIKDQQGNFLSDVVGDFPICLDQDGLGYCHAYSSVEGVMVRSAVANQPPILLSAESIGGPITNWRNRGAALEDDLNQFVEVGACDFAFMDEEHSLNPNNWKSGWSADCANHRILEWFDIETWDEVITSLFYRIPVIVGLDWWGHAVCYYDPVILPDGSVGIKFRNSWGRDWPIAGGEGWSTLTERKGTPSLGAFAPCIGTVSLS